MFLSQGSGWVICTYEKRGRVSECVHLPAGLWVDEMVGMRFGRGQLEVERTLFSHKALLLLLSEQAEKGWNPWDI